LQCSSSATIARCFATFTAAHRSSMIQRIYFPSTENASSTLPGFLRRRPSGRQLGIRSLLVSNSTLKLMALKNTKAFEIGIISRKGIFRVYALKCQCSMHILQYPSRTWDCGAPWRCPSGHYGSVAGASGLASAVHTKGLGLRFRLSTASTGTR
jgi:hypothetical protein